jgi:hypothetical protein
MCHLNTQSFYKDFANYHSFLVFQLEKEFNIKIPEDDALKMTTVQAVIDLVYKYGDAS